MKKNTFMSLLVLALLLSATNARAEGCIYAGVLYSDGAVVNGKVCDGRSGTWR